MKKETIVENQGIEFPTDFNNTNNTDTKVEIVVTNPTVIEKPIVKVNNGIKSWQDALMSLPNRFKQLDYDIKRTTLELSFATSIIRNSSVLKNCVPQSIFDAVIYSVRVGLTLNPAFGFAYLVPRRVNNEMKCCLDIGYKGWCAILKSYGSVTHIDAQIVYEDEKFDYNPAEGSIKHKPKFAKTEEEQKKRVVNCAYARAILPNGKIVFEVIPNWELLKIKNVSSASKGFSPYSEWESEMQKKAPIKRLAKKLLTLQEDDRVSAMFEAENVNSKEKEEKTLNDIF
jgi:recombination protein RecT